LLIRRAPGPHWLHEIQFDGYRVIDHRDL
jgi:ATP-dependent DNA ligase